MVRVRALLMGFLFASSTLLADEKPAAKVNGEEISLKEVDAALSTAPPPLAPLTTVQKRQQRLEAVSLLIDDKLVRQHLKTVPLQVDPSEVEKQFTALAAAQKVEGKTLAEFFKETGLTEAKIKDNYRLMLLLAKYIDSQIDDAKLKDYFATNKDFFERITVRTSHIVLRLPASASPQDREQARAKLQALRAKLVAGQIEFAAAAKEHSQCPSAPNGGDIGFISRKFQVDEEYAKAAFKMKTGEVSEIVTSDVGIHLIWVTERKPGTPITFEAATRDVRECLESDLRQALLLQLRAKAKIEVTVP
jgi:parvulin-like peptidyl-prolyl isomerase